MKRSLERDIYFSFFMFTADLRPDDRQYTQVIIRHMRKLLEYGYTGFDLPIAPTNVLDHRGELKSYEGLRKALDDADLGEIKLTTNVAAFRNFDPSSMDSEWREIGLSYLKSRIDITRALRATAMAGPLILPYNVFPTTASGEPIWSDALQEWLIPRYENAILSFERLAEHAARQDVKIAIEPVDHWETPAPNLVSGVIDFLEKLSSTSIGICIDSAHVTLGSDGPGVFKNEVERASAAKRLHYVHISAPDRGAVHDSWIPWKSFLTPICSAYKGPFLVEVFNAIPVFLNSLRLTRRKFWIPGDDTSEPGRPGAYAIASRAITTVRQEIGEIDRS